MPVLSRLLKSIACSIVLLGMMAMFSLLPAYALDEVSESNFEDIITNNDVVLVDFCAIWAGTCRILEPILDRVQADLGDTVKIVAMDVDANLEIALHYAVRNVPTMILFRNGKVANTLMGAHPQSEIVGFIQSNS